MPQREFHLSFCNNCANREFDLRNGIICGLSGKKANFQATCEDYQGDIKQILKRRETFLKTHPLSLRPGGNPGKKIIHQAKQGQIAFTFSKFKHAVLIGIFILFALAPLVLGGVFWDTLSKQDRVIIAFIAFVDLPLILILTANGLNKYKSDSLVFNKSGIHVNAQAIPWNQYIGIGYKEGLFGRRKHERFLIFHSIGSEPIEIKIDHLNGSWRKIIRTAQWYEMNFAHSKKFSAALSPDRTSNKI